MNMLPPKQHVSHESISPSDVGLLPIVLIITLEYELDFAMESIVHISPSVMILAGAIWPPVCAVVASLRFMTRRAQRTPLGMDDWLVLPALVHQSTIRT